MTRFLLGSLLLLFQIRSFSQSPNRDTSIVIKINPVKPDLKQLRTIIRDTAKFMFSYSPDEIDECQKINLPAKRMSVGAILNIIADTLNISYKISGDYIILIPRKKTLKHPRPMNSPRGIPLLHVSITDSLEAVEVSAWNPGNNMETSTSYLAMNCQFNEGYHSSLLSAIQGNIPGMHYVDANGVAGSTGKLQLRGQPSIGLIPGSGNIPARAPLILINGVAWANSNLSMARLSSMAGDPDGAVFQSGISPFNNIFPDDIESIQIYVGADATANFGSRGTHGVISIQTKKGYNSKGIRWSFHATRGMAVAASRIQLMNTSQYANMRTEAILNDGMTVNETTAPELFKWPLTRSTDWYEYLVGNTARIQKYYLSGSGRLGKHVNFYVGAGLQEETNLLPLKRPTQRGSVHANVNYSRGKKSSTQMSALVNLAHHRMPAINPMPFVNLAPNAPYPLDEKGNLVFEENGLSTSNIYAQLLNSYDARLLSVLGSVDHKYTIQDKLTFNMKLGINYNTLREASTFPKAAHAPQSLMTGRMEAASSYNLSLTADPYLQYADTSKGNKWNAILTLGANVQRQTESWNMLERGGYTYDHLIGNPDSAQYTTPKGGKSQYHYVGMYAAANLAFRSRYNLNLIARYDGSSRFGPGKQFGLFGAVGAGWTFSQTEWIRNLVNHPWMGKLRASIATTGSDQIGNNSYEDIYRLVNDGSSYAGIRPLQLEQIANPSLTWEKNVKKEIALDLKFNTLLSLSIAWYHTITSGQFISTITPAQNGFPSMQVVNHDASVLNRGFEIMLGINKSLGKEKAYTGQLTVTIPRNILLSFKDLENSLYSRSLIERQSLTVQPGLLFERVDPQTGLYTFRNVAGSPAVSIPEDLVPTGNLDPVLLGGIFNKIQLKQWAFECVVDFKKQKLYNPKLLRYLQPPGSFYSDMLTNQLAIFNDRWRVPGDISTNQRLSAYGYPAFNRSNSDYQSSEAGLVDGSYIRVKDLCLSYVFTQSKLEKLHLQKVRLFARIENLWKITNYKDGDPTILQPFSYPSLRKFMLGIEISY